MGPDGGEMRKRPVLGGQGPPPESLGLLPVSSGPHLEGPQAGKKMRIEMSGTEIRASKMDVMSLRGVLRGLPVESEAV